MSILSTIGNLASTEEALETTSVLAGAGAGVALYSAAGLILPLAIAGGVTAAGVVGYTYWQAAKDHSDKLQAVIHGHPVDRQIATNTKNTGDYATIPFNGENIRLHYFEAGQAHRERGTKVLIHGFASNAYQWSQMFDELAQDYHVIAIDLPGNGYSDFLPDHDYKTMLIPFLNTFFDQMGLSQIDLIGSSMGGLIAQYLADGNPRVRSLALLGGGGSKGKPGNAPWFVDAAVANLTPNWLPDFITDGIETAVTWHTLADVVHPTLSTLGSHDVEEFVRPYQSNNTDPKRDDEMRKARAAYAQMVTEAIEDKENQATQVAMQQRITQPTLILHSEWDATVPVANARAIHNQIPHSTLVVLTENEYPTTGHAMMSDSPQVTLRALTKFFEPDQPATPEESAFDDAKPGFWDQVMHTPETLGLFTVTTALGGGMFGLGGGAIALALGAPLLPTIGIGLVCGGGGMLLAASGKWAQAQDHSDRTHTTIQNQPIARAIGVNTSNLGNYASVTVNGETRRVHYFEGGVQNRETAFASGEAQGTLLLVHGFGSNAYQFSQIFDELAQKYHVIAIDLPGSGYSDSLPDHDYDFDTVLPLWLNQFLDDKGLTSHITLVASSLGGPISQSLALDNPRIARIMLFDSMEPRGKPTDVSWLQEQVVKGIDLTGMPTISNAAETFATWATLAWYVHPELNQFNSHDVGQFAGPYLIGDNNTRKEVRERQQARIGYSKEEIELIKDPDEMARRRILKSQLTQPTLVVQSEWDGFVPEKTGHTLDGEIPRSELLVIPHQNVPTAGHTLMNDTPALAIKIIDDYLQGNPELNRVTNENSYLVYEEDQYYRIVV